MKRIALFILFIPTVSSAGVITTIFGAGGGTVIYSSGPYVPGIAFDSSTVSGQVSGASPLNFNLLIGSKSNRFLAVGCGTYNSDVVSSVTVGGNFLNLSTNTNNGIYGSSIWTTTGPAAGSQNINVYTTSGISDRVFCIAASWSGVSQTSPVDFSTGTIVNSAGTLTVTLTTSQKGDALFDIIKDGNSETIVPGTGQAAKASTSVFYYTATASTMSATAVGSNNMSWSSVSSPDSYNAIAITPSPTP